MSVRTATKKEAGCRSGTSCQPLGWQNWRGDKRNERREKVLAEIGVRNKQDMGWSVRQNPRPKKGERVSVHNNLDDIPDNSRSYVLTAPQGDSSWAWLSLAQRNRLWKLSICLNNMTMAPKLWLNDRPWESISSCFFNHNIVVLKKLSIFTWNSLLWGKVVTFSTTF